VILNRTNVIFTGMAQSYERSYSPTWMEWVGFVGLLIGAVLVILFFVENFRVLEGDPGHHAKKEPATKPASVEA